MSDLPLAVHIAETVDEVLAGDGRVDVSATAEKLLVAHPEAKATKPEVESTLVEELEGPQRFGGR